MLSPIQMYNMECALGYPSLGYYASAPSFANGYRMCDVNSMYNVPFYGMTPSYYNNVGYTNPVVNSNANVSSNGLSKESIQQDVNTLAKYYMDNNAMEAGGIGGAIIGGATFTLMENPQSLFHPFNALNANKSVSKEMKALMEAKPALKDLWKTEYETMSNAYAEWFRVNRNSQKKLTKLFINNKAYAQDLDYMNKLMKDALNTGNVEEIKRATEELRQVKCNGWITRNFNRYIGTPGKKAFNYIANPVRKLIGKSPVPLDTIRPKEFKGPMETIVAARENGLIDNALHAAKAEKSLNLLKRGFKEGKGWFIFDMLLSSGKIIKAFTHEDGGTEAGFKQLGQSAVKAAGNAVGWVAGKAVGGWAGAKLGAAIGSVVPGLGTIAGSIIGFIGGSIGSWAVSKFLEKKMGPEVADKLDAKDKTKTAQGQAELLQYAVQKAQKGEAVPQNVQQAAINLMSTMA